MNRVGFLFEPTHPKQGIKVFVNVFGVINACRKLEFSS